MNHPLVSLRPHRDTRVFEVDHPASQRWKQARLGAMALEAPPRLTWVPVDWLEKHGFPFVDVYVGQGKPRVNAIIDDRAVACQPQYDTNAFADAEKNLRALLKRKPAQATVREPKFNIRRGKVE